MRFPQHLLQICPDCKCPNLFSLGKHRIFRTKYIAKNMPSELLLSHTIQPNEVEIILKLRATKTFAHQSQQVCTCILHIRGRVLLNSTWQKKVYHICVACTSRRAYRSSKAQRCCNRIHWPLPNVDPSQGGSLPN